MSPLLAFLVDVGTWAQAHQDLTLIVCGVGMLVLGGLTFAYRNTFRRHRW